MRTDLKLGQKLKDPVSGFTGIAVMLAEHFSGTVQYALQPPGAENKLEDGQFIDEHVLEVVDEAFAGKLPPVDDSVTIHLGEKVKDAITGFTGIAVEKVTY